MLEDPFEPEWTKAVKGIPDLPRDDKFAKEVASFLDCIIEGFDSGDIPPGYKGPILRMSSAFASWMKESGDE